MSRNLPAQIILEKNRLKSSEPWLILLEITLNNDDETVIRFVRNTEDITFEGNVYTRFAFELEPTKYSSQGEIPTLTLRVSNITRLLQPYIEALEGGVGSTVKITVVNTRLLSENYSELEEIFDVLATSTSDLWIEFILGAPSLLRQRLPLYRYLALHCRWQFKGLECNYSGDEITCNRTYNDCRDRDNTANFGGFVGLKAGGIKIAR